MDPTAVLFDLDGTITDSGPVITHAREVPLAVATSKRQSLAEAVIATSRLAPFFVAVRGASEDETHSAKADIIAAALTALRDAGADLSRAVMVGDRRYDVEGAREHGLPTVLVTWGYSTPAEREEAYAVVSDPQGLATLLS